MTFRLTTLLYLFALVASSMAVLGPWGLLAGLILFAIWAYVYWHPRSRREWVGIALVLFMLGLLGMCLFPSITDVRTPSRRTMSINNLKNISLGLLHYHDKHGHFPPPYVADKQGKPLYSWRVLVLPYVEQDALAKRYRHDQPWDSPHNRALLVDLGVFQSPRFSPPYTNDKLVDGETHYFAIVGDGTIWDPNQTVAASDVTDGLSNTMLLIEVQGTGIKWSEPRDFTLDEAIALLQEASDEQWVKPGYFVSTRYQYRPQGYRCVAFAEGRVDVVYSGSDPADFRAMLTRAGGEPPKELRDQLRPATPKSLGAIIHWGRIWGLTVWIAIIALPANRRLAIFPAKKKEQEAQLRELHSPEVDLHEE